MADPYYVTENKIFIPDDENLKAFKVDTTILFTDPAETLLTVHYPDQTVKYLLPKQEYKLKADLEKYKSIKQ